MSFFQMFGKPNDRSVANRSRDQNSQTDFDFDDAAIDGDNIGVRVDPRNTGARPRPRSAPKATRSGSTGSSRPDPNDPDNMLMAERVFYGHSGQDDHWNINTVNETKEEEEGDEGAPPVCPAPRDRCQDQAQACPARDPCADPCNDPCVQKYSRCVQRCMAQEEDPCEQREHEVEKPPPSPSRRRSYIRPCNDKCGRSSSRSRERTPEVSNPIKPRRQCSDLCRVAKKTQERASDLCKPKNDPCADSCQREDPCAPADPCPPKDRCFDPCAQQDPCNDPCKKPKKKPRCVDPCKPKDPCQNADPCRVRDPCATADPCAPKDPCCQPQPDPCDPCAQPDPCAEDPLVPCDPCEGPCEQEVEEAEEECEPAEPVCPPCPPCPEPQPPPSPKNTTGYRPCGASSSPRRTASPVEVYDSPSPQKQLSMTQVDDKSERSRSACPEPLFPICKENDEPCSEAICSDDTVSST